MDHHTDMQICFSLAAKDDNLLAMLSPEPAATLL